MSPSTTIRTSATSARLFGTDGIRAPFGEPPLDRPTVTAVARALARSLHDEVGGEPRVVLGGDTRASTPEICRWVAAGLAAGGARPHYVGVLPTPAIAYLVGALGADAGVTVSASHNPLPDNGVKVIDRHGHKLSEAAEAALEARLGELGDDGDVRRHPELAADPEAAEVYLASLVERVRGSLGSERPLAGLGVGLDAAHGAAAPYAERLFSDLGARVVAFGDQPNGENINVERGSTHPEHLAAEVTRQGLDLGIAFDGDADRAILVDERGAERDGDAILYLWARHLLSSGGLVPPKIVATSMSNLGLERALAEIGIEVVRCGVGDRVVVETMQREGIVLGGEQSGHVVNLELSTTGDGLLTGLTLAGLAAAAGQPLSELLAGFVRYPQVLLNVAVAGKPDLEGLPKVAAAKRRVEDELGADGRLVLRYSGTEPLARVMIEGPDQETIDRLAGELAAAIDQEIGRR